MGDYLSELATKNIGTADVIQPRRAARFEPVNALFDAKAGPIFAEPESFDFEEPFAERASDVELRHGRARVREKGKAVPAQNDPEQPTPPPQASTAPVHTPAGEQSGERIHVSPQIIEEVRAARQEIFSRPDRSSPPAAAPEKSLPAIVNQPEATQNVVENATIQPRFAPPIPESRPPETKNAEPTADRPAVGERPSPIVAKPRVSKTENRFEASAAEQAKIMPARPSVSKQITKSAPKREVSVINVTIGRVEVRAVQTAGAPVRESRAKPPALSLDEYLRQRGGGGGGGR